MFNGEEYQYKIAMYIYGDYTAFYKLEEKNNGYFVPVRFLSGGRGKEDYFDDVRIGMNQINVFEKYEKENKYHQELNIYQELVGTFFSSGDSVNSERLFWEDVTGIHFYVKPSGEYTIVALQRANDSSAYIKKIHIPNNYSHNEFQDVVLELIQEVHNYRENPEQTPVNIEGYRKDESIGKHRFPWQINIYKGEKRLLIIPYLDHVAGFRRQPDKMVVLDENASAEEIGNGIMEVLEIIKTSPRLAGMTQGYWLATKYKGWKTFSKKNNLVTLEVNEDFSYKIYAEECPKSDGLYQIVGDVKYIDADITVEGLGNCIIECFQVLPSIGKKEHDPYPIKSVELMDGSMLTVKHPSDKHFYDYEDAHAGEIYQCYCYMVHGEEGESSAEFFLGIAPEIDCNLDLENVCHSWQDVYGKAELFEMKEDSYGIFTHRAEIKNKKTHKISYFLQMEEDLILECGMDVHQPNKRKKTDEKLGHLFQEFAMNCKKSEKEKYQP
ncbi:MAG: hypothetical protein HFJ09_08000 [Lachnospiraceae bacterium]|nr:hypothetical protein [Lachnospiraceae bacterium]